MSVLGEKRNADSWSRFLGIWERLQFDKKSNGKPLSSPFPILKGLQYSPIEDQEPEQRESAEGVLIQRLTKTQNTIRIWQIISALLAISMAPEEGTDNVLRWMKEAEVAEGHFWCGNSTAEAKRRGCTFHKLHNRWMSPVCTRDFEYAKTAVFEALGGEPEFHFFKDRDGEPGDEISDDELNELELLTPAWTTVGHHMSHCMYLLLQAAAAMNLGTKADMVVHTWEHAKHCATVILQETKSVPEWNDVTSFGHTQSGVCW
ncbi:hypothetical protein CCHL11_09277 [Colletotrichum chlorophyti]|uniref:Uncharacterized protein n=1 Tax=Colletotrichum chlorophyti TaxID=708187 RepID=A0A1Q8RC90_9PEZI|nr:hypothetical protein CCHL11_09277 [Colletotrichum chlorophyti]